MNYGYYYVIFFVFIGLLILVFYNNQQYQQQQYQQLIHQQQQQQQQQQQHNKNQVLAANNKNKMNMNEDHLKIYNDYSNYKKTNNINNNTEIYTYNIDNIDILNDNPSNNNNKLGNPNDNNYQPELEEVYNTTLRGYVNNDNDSTKPDEIYDYSIKPNKSDLPIINPPLQLLQTNAPLRLSEKHLM